MLPEPHRAHSRIVEWRVRKLAEVSRRRYRHAEACTDRRAFRDAVVSGRHGSGAGRAGATAAACRRSDPRRHTGGRLDEAAIKSDIANAGYKKVKGLEFKDGV